MNDFWFLSFSLSLSSFFLKENQIFIITHKDSHSHSLNDLLESGICHLVHIKIQKRQRNLNIVRD